MNNRGFTLVELIVVVAILAIMLTIAVPPLSRWQQEAKYKEVAREILVGLREARSNAVTKNENITATIDLGAHQLTYDGVSRTFPAHIKLEAKTATGDGWSIAGTKATVFKPQGSTTRTLFIRVNEDPELEVKIESATTGMARM